MSFVRLPVRGEKEKGVLLLQPRDFSVIFQSDKRRVILPLDCCHFPFASPMPLSLPSSSSSTSSSSTSSSSSSSSSCEHMEIRLQLQVKSNMSVVKSKQETKEREDWGEGEPICVKDYGGEEEVKLYAINNMEFNQFKEAASLCRNMIKMRLILNNCIRDVFFDGVFSDPQVKDGVLFENVGACLRETCSSIVEEIRKGDAEDIDETQVFSADTSAVSTTTTKTPRKKKKLSHSQPSSCQLDYSCVTCVYCDFAGDLSRRNIIVHPFVPVTMDGKVLYLCTSCHSNWLAYRQSALKEKLLILPGELNEEVCSICSDSPDELILCSTCPRSYCPACLCKVLTQKQFTAMTTSKNWRCLCCVHSTEDFKYFTKCLKLSISTHKSVPPLPIQDYTHHIPAKGHDVPEASKDNKMLIENCDTKRRKKNEESAAGLELDDVFYFSQYVNMRRNTQSSSASSGKRKSSRSRAKEQSSEDFCFLCKDGGDLVECDHVSSSEGRRQQRCEKVYHEYCLGFNIPDNEDPWICPRHVCSVCGGENELVHCKFCPASSCRGCLCKWIATNGWQKIAVFFGNSRGPASGVVGLGEVEALIPRNCAKVTCGSCLALLFRSFERGLLKEEKTSFGTLLEVRSADSERTNDLSAVKYDSEVL